MELWDLYDEHRAPLGRTHQRGLPLAPGEYHLAVIVVIAFLSVILMNWAGLRADRKKR